MTCMKDGRAKCDRCDGHGYEPTQDGGYVELPIGEYLECGECDGQAVWLCPCEKCQYWHQDWPELEERA